MCINQAGSQRGEQEHPVGSSSWTSPGLVNPRKHRLQPVRHTWWVGGGPEEQSRLDFGFARPGC